MPVRERLPDPAEIDGGQFIQRGQPIQDSGERGFAHATDRLVPAVAEAGGAIQVAGVGRLDVELRQVGHRPVQAQAVAPRLQPHLCARNQAQLGRNLRRHHQMALVVNMRPRHLRRCFGGTLEKG